MCAAGGAGWGTHGKKKKKERAEVEQKSFPRLDPRGLKEADKDISRRSIKRQQAKKKTLSPHRGQARPLVSGVGNAALLPLFLSRKTGKSRHACKGKLQGGSDLERGLQSVEGARQPQLPRPRHEMC